MHIATFAVLPLLFRISPAQDIDNNDVPIECRSVCQTVIDAARTCDQRNDDNDRGYVDCVCTSSNASSAVPLCAACIAQYENDDDDNDVYDLVRSCSFSSTTYSSGSSYTVASMTPSGGIGASSGSLTTNTATDATKTSIDSSRLSSAQSVASTATRDALSSASSVLSSVTAGAGGATSSVVSVATQATDTGNAAPSIFVEVEKVAALAVIGVAMML